MYRNNKENHRAGADRQPTSAARSSGASLPTPVRQLYTAYREELPELIRAALARACLQAFVLYTCPDYAMGWVHEKICRELDDFFARVAARQSPRLMIAMPPRHGKSELATRRFPAYAFGRNPDLHIISTSYAAGLATRMNRDVQRIMDSASYRVLFPDTILPGANKEDGLAPGTNGTNREGNTKGARKSVGQAPGRRQGDTGARPRRKSDMFEIVGRSGTCRSAGVGGGITGMGGDILIIDDPFKDRAQADSLAIRTKVWDWYTSTLYTRLSPGGGILLIQTRWHIDDLAGRLLEAASAGSGDQWRCVNFPAIAEYDEPRRKAGQALHPDRYPLSRLRAIRSALGPRDWEALYQQKPVPHGGAVFQESWLRYWLPKDLPDRFDRMLMSWDMAFKDSHDADFVVGQVWARKGARFYLLDQVRARMGFTATLQAFVSLASHWPGALEKLVEDKANGPAVIDSLKQSVTGIISVTPQGSKAARAHAVTPLFEAGNVFVPHPQVCLWTPAYVSELLRFPADANDDQVDATTQALHRLQQKAGIAFNPANLMRAMGKRVR